MAQSVSNDALWEKLSELDKILEKLSEIQIASKLSDARAIVTPDFQKEKDEIITEIQEQTYKLGKHSDINFGAVNLNIKPLDENMRKVWNIVNRIRKQQKETIEPQKTDCSYINFRFFKVKKTSLVIAVLGLLVFILTVFCMKQQNDYALLLDEFYRQNVAIKEATNEDE